MGRKNCDQRQGHGHHRETDLACALQGSLERGAALFEVADDVLQDHDYIVDDEAGGNGNGHEREVIDGVAHQIERAEGAD